MAKNDDFLKNLQQMDPARLQALLQQATAALTPAQRQKLAALMNDPKRMEQLKNSISDKDVTQLANNLKNGQTLEGYLRRGDIQKRIDELL